MNLDEFYSPYEANLPGWLSHAFVALDELGEGKEIRQAKLALSCIECDMIQPPDIIKWIGSPKRIMMAWISGRKRTMKQMEFYVSANGFEKFNLVSGIAVMPPPSYPDGFDTIQAIRDAANWFFGELAGGNPDLNDWKA